MVMVMVMVVVVVVVVVDVVVWCVCVCVCVVCVVCGVSRRCLCCLVKKIRMNSLISVPRLRIPMSSHFGRHVTVHPVINRLWADISAIWDVISPGAARYYEISSDIFMKSRRPVWCPRLTVVHRRHRLEWGLRHWVYDCHNWMHCIFSDESSSSQHHSNGRARGRWWQCERLIDACIQQTHENPGPSVMIWYAIHHDGRSKLVILDGIMNMHRYIKIVRDHMLPCAKGVFRRNFVLCKTIVRHI